MNIRRRGTRCFWRWGRRKRGQTLLRCIRLTARLGEDAERWVREEHPAAGPLDIAHPYDAMWLRIAARDLNIDGEFGAIPLRLLKLMQRRYVASLPRLTEFVARLNAFVPWPDTPWEGEAPYDPVRVN